MQRFNNPEEEKLAEALRALHTPKLDEFRTLLPEIYTSNLIQHMINPMAIMKELTGYDPAEEQRGSFALVLTQPTPERLEEIQMTMSAALLAICEEIDERMPPRKAAPTTSG